MRLGRTITAVAGGSASVLIGAVVGLGPWIWHFNRGGSWSLATKTDFWTGLTLVMIGLAAIALYQSDLYRSLAAAGLVVRRARVEEQVEPLTESSSPEPLTDQALLELATRVVQEMQTEVSAGGSAAGEEVASVDSPAISEADLITLASQLIREIQSDAAQPAAPQTAADESGSSDPLALASDAELARMAASLLQEIHETRQHAMAPAVEEDDGRE